MPPPTAGEGGCVSGCSHPGFCGKNTVCVQRGLQNTWSQGKVQPGDGLLGWGTTAPKPWHQTPWASPQLLEDGLHKAALVIPPCKAADAVILLYWKKREKGASPLQANLWLQRSRAGPIPGFPVCPCFRGSAFCPSVAGGHTLSAREQLPPALSLLLPLTPQEWGDRHHHRPGCPAAEQPAWRHH